MILLWLIFIWHLDLNIVLDCFKDCDFWIMDIVIRYFYCYCTAWNEGFSSRGWVSVDGQSPQIFWWETQWATRNFSLWKISAQWNWMEKLVFCVVFIYLFFLCLFIGCLYVCFLITLRDLFVGLCINCVV